MSDHRADDKGPGGHSDTGAGKRPASTTADPLELIEQCLAAFPDNDPRQQILYKLRHSVMLNAATQQQREAEYKKISEVVGKLTAPANRIGT